MKMNGCNVITMRSAQEFSQLIAIQNTNCNICGYNENKIME